MSEQPTGDTDQAPHADLFLYAEQPRRAQEIARLNRLKWLERFWLIVALSGQLLGTFLILRYAPDPLKLLLIVVWSISVVGHIQHGGSFAKKWVIENDHMWEDRSDRLWRDTNRFVLDPLRNFADRVLSTNADLDKGIDQLVAAVNDEGHEQERRGRGRKPLSEAEIKSDLAKMDRAAAKIEAATGRKATQEDIYKETGIPPKTQQRRRQGQ